MHQYYGLLSMVFMMCFVVLFDRMHNGRLWDKSLLGREEVDQLLLIWQACQDS